MREYICTDFKYLVFIRAVILFSFIMSNALELKAMTDDSTVTDVISFLPTPLNLEFAITSIKNADIDCHLIFGYGLI